MKTLHDIALDRARSAEQKRIEAEASARRGRNGHKTTERSRRTDALVDLRHAMQELERAIAEVEQADLTSPVHFAESMDSPMSRAHLAKKTLGGLLKRQRWGVEDDE